MTMELDVKIGQAFYGWAEEKSETNPWFDPWAKLWRPVPGYKETATPAFSTSTLYAFRFVEYLHQNFGIQTDIEYNGKYWVYMETSKNKKYGQSHGSSLPETICKCALNLAKDSEENIYENIFQLKPSISV